MTTYERGEHAKPTHPNVSDCPPHTLRQGRDWLQARDHMPPGLDLMLLPMAFALNAADVFAAFWLRGR